MAKTSPAAPRVARARSALPRRVNGKPAAARTAMHLETALGTTIRRLRVIKGLRLRDLAGRSACSESLLSKIENSRASPSLTMLHRIAHSLDVTVPALFAAPTAVAGVVVRQGERPSMSIDAKGSRLEQLVASESGHLLEGNLHVLAPGGGSEGTLAHDGEEVGFVVTGELELTVAGKTYRLASGDSFAFRSDMPHSHRNPGKTETRVVWVSTPPTF